MKLDPITQAMVGNGVPKGIVVLMYHSITEAQHATWPWEVTLADFTAQLDYLVDRSIGVFPVGRLLDSDCPLSGVVITFDDGYANNMNAAKLMYERGLSATWYVVSNEVGAVSSWAKGSEQVLPMMSQAELKALDEMGMEVGAHSRTHCDLIQQSPQSIQDEIYGSKQDLENILSKSVESFAYPYGHFNNSIIETVKQVGFRSACITRSGWYRPEEDKLQVRRITVFGSDNVSTFARKLIFADNNVSWPKMMRYMTRRVMTRGA